MENSRGPSSIRNVVYKGKGPLLRPKVPFSGVSSSFSDYIPVSAIGQSAPRRPIEGNLHQRTSSESVLIEEPPSWLNELLDEPDTPVQRGHRRSSSDSLAYFDASTAKNMTHVAQDDSKFRGVRQQSIWGSQVFDIGHTNNSSFPADTNHFAKNGNRSWHAAQGSLVPKLASPRENAIVPTTETVTISQDVDANGYVLVENKNRVETGAWDSDASFQKMDGMSAVPEPDTRRAKQQYARRSRVRKLQYIAELERNVQTLHAEGSEVSAEIEFQNHQNLILSMENNTLTQLLESLSQEQLIKCLEHDMLEREATRLRTLYQTLLLQQQTPPDHRRSRSRSRDLDQQLFKLSLKQKE